nr:hypothetical protein HUO10_005224 [Paraburkholderia busanensis]
MRALRRVIQSLPFIGISVSIALSSAVMAAATNRTTLAPIDLGTAGKTAVLDFNVSSSSDLANHNPTVLALQIVGPAGGEEVKHAQFSDLIMSVTGTPYGSRTEQEIAHPKAHRSIKLHVVWHDRLNDKVLKEGDVFTGSDWEGKIHAVPGPSLTLDSLKLPPGHYDVTVTTLSDDPRFDGTFKTGICAGKIWE